MYNLNDNVNDNFEFELNGQKYKMRYPTLEETEALGKIIQANPGNDDKMMEFVYSYITAQGGAPDIQELLPKQNIRIVHNMGNMIRKEFFGG